MRLLMELQALAAEEDEEAEAEADGAGRGPGGGGRFATLEVAWAEKPRPAPSLGDVRSETVGCVAWCVSCLCGWGLPSLLVPAAQRAGVEVNGISKLHSCGPGRCVGK